MPGAVLGVGTTAKGHKVTIPVLRKPSKMSGKWIPKAIVSTNHVPAVVLSSVNTIGINETVTHKPDTTRGANCEHRGGPWARAQHATVERGSGLRIG